MFAASTYQKRRQALIEQIDYGVIVLFTHSKVRYSNDKYFKFRPHSDFLYFTGIEEADAVCVINAQDGATFLFVKEKDPKTEQWHGRHLGTALASQISGIDQCYSLQTLNHRLEELLSTTSVVYFQTAVHLPHEQQLVSIMDQYRLEHRDPTHYFHEFRVIKSPEELEVIQKSVDISVEAHKQAIKATAAYLSEYQIEAEYDYVFRRYGARMPTQTAIIAGGENATILHHEASAKILRAGELLLVDAGCEYGYYTADISRTWPVTGKFSEAQREIYELVLNVQDICISMVKPGIKYWDIHRKAVEELTKGFIAIGLLSGPLEMELETKGYRRFFMHGIGHWLGMDTHDSGTIPRETVELVPGHYLTIEPGIYIMAAEDIPEKYHDIGVRIEDNVVVTTDGCEVLSKGLPKTVEEIEALVGRKYFTKRVEVQEYNPDWSKWFEEISERIMTHLGGLALDIEHVGSTSVPNLAAKPKIDIDIVIKLDDFNKVAAKLQHLGYVHIGDLGITGREAFKLVDPSSLPDHNLYVCDHQAEELHQHVAFRNYLRAHPQEAEEYGRVKFKAAEHHPNSIDDYIEEKSPLVISILEKAMKEYTPRQYL